MTHTHIRRSETRTVCGLDTDSRTVIIARPPAESTCGKCREVKPEPKTCPRCGISTRGAHQCHLDEDMYQSLLRLRRVHGRYWKRYLRNCWLTNQDPGWDAASTSALRRLRNIGSNALEKIVLPEVGS